MRRALSALSVLSVLVLSPHFVEAAQSFAYVATCGQSSNCLAPQLLVYDANTARLVTSIDLPPGTPRNAAMTLDGTRLYVSIAGSTGARLAVVDTTAHVLAGSYAAPVAGDVAVARDGARVFVLARGSPSDSIIYAFDTSAHAFAPFVTAPPLAYHIATNPARDRLYVTSGYTPENGVRAYDSVTGALLATSTPVSCLMPSTCRALTALAVSPDGNRVYFADHFWWVTSWIHVLDAGSLQESTNLRALGLALAEADAYQRLYIGGNFTLSWSTGLLTGSTSSAVDDSIALPGLVNGVAFSRDAARTWVSMFSDNVPDPDQVDGLAVIDTAGGTLLRTIPLLTAPTPIVATPKHATAACSYTLDKAHSPWTIPGGTTTITLTTPCAWSASSDAAWARIDSSIGLGTTTFTLTVDPNPLAENRTATLVIAGQVVTVPQAGGASAAPFGFVDTPTDNVTNVAGELAVTGWVLDDVGTTRVQIYRDPVSGETPGQPIYIGDATFVDGARPDVQAVYPSYPLASRAGWGYMLLTNVLPGGGTGTYRLSAIATDIEGRQTVLGARTITCTNAASAVPFGTLDTPGQGETASGTIVNFGWALTPQPKVVPFDGSTIDVVIDGVVVGHPTYGFARSDVDTLFSGYTNASRAVGYFVIDTTTLTNGLHTIAWIVRDNQGGTAGIGARFFRVVNP